MLEKSYDYMLKNVGIGIIALTCNYNQWNAKMIAAINKKIQWNAKMIPSAVQLTYNFNTIYMQL